MYPLQGQRDVWYLGLDECRPRFRIERKGIQRWGLFIYLSEVWPSTVVPFGTLYHDVKHRFLLFFDFFKPDDFNYKPIDVSNEPGVENYTFRHVTGIWRLKEKIVILEKGLNDVAIERMKYMIKRDLCKTFHPLNFHLYNFKWVNIYKQRMSLWGNFSVNTLFYGCVHTYLIQLHTIIPGVLYKL